MKTDRGKIACLHLLKDIVLKKRTTSATTDETFCCCRGIITREGTNWALEQGGVHLEFPPDAVSEPMPIVVHRWKYSAFSPPLQEHEAIASSVIELSPMDSQSLKFNTKVKLSLSHSATNLQGYELVIKMLINKEANIWEEVSGTMDIRCYQGIGSSFIQICRRKCAIYQSINQALFTVSFH